MGRGKIYPTSKAKQLLNPARRLVQSPRRLVSQIDGGSGHSGRRSPELHFGIGTVEKNKPVKVEIKWRDTEGKVQQSIQQLLPGWHTIRLRDTNGIAVTTPLQASR